MYLYVIAERPNGPCKIGFADNPTKRLAQLQLATYRPLDLVFQDETKHHRRAERIAHSIVWKHHIRGEWFKISIHTAIKAAETGIDAADKYREPFYPQPLKQQIAERAKTAGYTPPNRQTARLNAIAQFRNLDQQIANAKRGTLDQAEIGDLRRLTKLRMLARQRSHDEQP